jgi:hypothetical protein
VFTSHEIPYLFQLIAGQPAALPDVSNHNVEYDVRFGRRFRDILERPRRKIPECEKTSVCGPHAFISFPFPVRYPIPPPLPVSFMMFVLMLSDQVTPATLNNLVFFIISMVLTALPQSLLQYVFWKDWLR